MGNIDAKMMTKHAVMLVLDVNTWLGSVDILRALDSFNYRRAPSTVRRALQKIVALGLADAKRSHDAVNPHGRSSWLLTATGLQYTSSPDFGKLPTKQPKVGKTRRSKKSNGTQSSAPSGATGGTTMCIDLSKPTLNAAIESLVLACIGTRKKFSAHDITNELRNHVNDASIVVDSNETGTVFVNGKDVPNISHDYVRDAVHEIFHQGKMTGYDRRHNGTFWEYEELVVLPVVAIPASAAVADDQPAADPQKPSSATDYDGTPTL